MNYILETMVGMPDLELYPHLEEFYYVATLVLTVVIVGFTLRMLFGIFQIFFAK